MRTIPIICLPLLFSLLLVACKKKGSGGDGNNGSGPPPSPVVDPAVASTVGFFLDDWRNRSYTPPPSIDTIPAWGSIGAYVTIDASSILAKIPPAIFGQNANSWMSQMVTEPVLIDHLSALQSNIIRFPGGSISDLYFWNAAPGAAPADAPELLPDASGNMLPAGYWYGGNTASWTISLPNYYATLQRTGNEGMITVNYGYARYGKGPDPVAKAAHLAADWVRYDNGRTKYWEIGNECNGTWEAGYRINTQTNADGQPQIITGSLYGKHVRVFADSMKKAAAEIGKTIHIGAYLLEKTPEAWQTPTDQSWNAGVLAELQNKADFFVIHSYYTPYQQNSNAELILNTALTNTKEMMDFVKASVTAAGAQQKPVALTEWNITSQGSRQQVSAVNGVHAAILLGESIKNQYGMTARWDLANGWSEGNDHGLFNIGDEPGVSKWNPRPAFYYLYYFRKTLGDRLLSATVLGDVLAYPSSFSSGEKAVVLVNRSASAQTTSISVRNGSVGGRFHWYLLKGGSDNGEFSSRVYVNGRGPSEPSGGPAQLYKDIKAYSASTQGGIRITLPPRSVAYLVIARPN